MRVARTADEAPLEALAEAVGGARTKPSITLPCSSKAGSGKQLGQTCAEAFRASPPEVKTCYVGGMMQAADSP